jgi:hypothetical protein
VMSTYLLTEYDSLHYQMKMNETGKARKTYWAKILMEERHGKRSFGRPGHRWEDNIVHLSFLALSPSPVLWQLNASFLPCRIRLANSLVHVQYVVDKGDSGFANQCQCTSASYSAINCGSTRSPLVVTVPHTLPHPM